MQPGCRFFWLHDATCRRWQYGFPNSPPSFISGNLAVATWTPPAEIKFSYKAATSCKGKNMLPYLVNTRHWKLHSSLLKDSQKTKHLIFCASEWLVQLVVVQMLLNHLCHFHHVSRCSRHWQWRWKMQRHKALLKSCGCVEKCTGKSTGKTCWSHTKSCANCKTCTVACRLEYPSSLF